MKKKEEEGKKKKLDKLGGVWDPVKIKLNRIKRQKLKRKEIVL